VFVFGFRTKPIWAPSQLFVCSHTPTVHPTTISGFLCNFSPRTAPQFFCQHDSPSNLAESRYPRHNAESRLSSCNCKSRVATASYDSLAMLIDFIYESRDLRTQLAFMKLLWIYKNLSKVSSLASSHSPYNTELDFETFKRRCKSHKCRHCWYTWVSQRCIWHSPYITELDFWEIFNSSIGDVTFIDETTADIHRILKSQLFGYFT